jgi:hypothetical protein
MFCVSEDPPKQVAGNEPNALVTRNILDQTVPLHRKYGIRATARGELETMSRPAAAANQRVAAFILDLYRQFLDVRTRRWRLPPQPSWASQRPWPATQIRNAQKRNGMRWRILELGRQRER